MCWITKISAITREWADTTTTMPTSSDMDWHRFETRTYAAPDHNHEIITTSFDKDTTRTGYDHDSKNKFNIGKIHNKNYLKLVNMYESV